RGAGALAGTGPADRGDAVTAPREPAARRAFSAGGGGREAAAARSGAPGTGKAGRRVRRPALSGPGGPGPSRELPPPGNRHAPGRSLRALAGDTGQQGADFRLAVAAVAAERPDRGQLARLGPAGHGIV